MYVLILIVACKSYAKVLIISDKILLKAEKVVTLQSLFGVTDDGKKSSPIMLRENDKQI